MPELATSLLASLQKLVLERQLDGRFVLRGALPAWCRNLRTCVGEYAGPVVIEEIFPFLEAFLPEAERAWRGAPAGATGPWPGGRALGHPLGWAAAGLRGRFVTR